MFNQPGEPNKKRKRDKIKAWFKKPSEISKLTASFQVLTNYESKKSKIKTKSSKIEDTLELSGHDINHSIGENGFYRILESNPEERHILESFNFDLDAPAGFNVSGERSAFVYEKIINAVSIDKDNLTLTIQTPQNQNEENRIALSEIGFNIAFNTSEINTGVLAILFEEWLNENEFQANLFTKRTIPNELKEILTHSPFSQLSEVVKIFQIQDPIQFSHEAIFYLSKKGVVVSHLNSKDIESTKKALFGFFQKSLKKLIEDNSSQTLSSTTILALYFRREDLAAKLFDSPELRTQQLALNSIFKESYGIKDFQKHTLGTLYLYNSAIQDYLKDFEAENITYEQGKIVIKNLSTRMSQLESDVYMNLSFRNKEDDFNTEHYVATDLDPAKTAKLQSKLQTILGPTEKAIKSLRSLQKQRLLDDKELQQLKLLQLEWIELKKSPECQKILSKLATFKGVSHL
ncbi:MAG: hypothetical protein ACRCXZ_09615 [Patescibacteria group bacterium]